MDIVGKSVTGLQPRTAVPGTEAGLIDIVNPEVSTFSVTVCFGADIVNSFDSIDPWSISQMPPRSVLSLLSQKAPTSMFDCIGLLSKRTVFLVVF